GLRGPSLEPGGPRLLLLGDSFVLGTGVEDDQCVSALLQKHLGPRGWRVVNAEVDSYAPILEYLWLRERGLALHPDVVVLAYDMSDLLQEREYRRAATFGPDGDPLTVSHDRTQGALGALGRLEHALRRHLYFTSWALRRLGEVDEWNTGTRVLEGDLPD